MEKQEVEIEEKTIDRQCVNEFIVLLDDIIDKYDTILSLGCGAGVQAVGDMFPEIPVIPALNTEFLGENQKPGVMGGELPWMRGLYALLFWRCLSFGAVFQATLQRALWGLGEW